MKKRITVALCAIFATTLLSGCASSQTDENTSSDNTSLSSSSSIVSDPGAIISSSSSTSASASDAGDAGDYSNKIISFTRSLQNASQSANAALSNADVAAANKAQETADNVYTLVSAATPPKGYEKSHQAFLGYALNMKYAIGYMQAATVAKSTGDTQLTAYYENLSAESLSEAADDAEEATALLNAGK